MSKISKFVAIILLFVSINGIKGLDFEKNYACDIVNKTIEFSDKTDCIQISHNEIPKSVTHLKIRAAICNVRKELFEQVTCIKNLDLSFCNISEIEERAFSTLNDLVALKLSNNMIDFIIDEIFSGLNQLQELFLDGNGIKVIMEDSFRSLESLKILNLANNHLLEMPGELPSSLMEINIMNNEIERISMEKLNNLMELEIFKLIGNDIGNWPRGDFFPKLKQFSIGDKIVTSSDKNSNLPRIETVHLSAKKLNSSKMNDNLAEKISAQTSLQNLYLENYEISSFGFLENLSNLTSLNLNNIYYRAESIKQFPTNLTSLAINGSAYLTDLLLQTTSFFHRLTILSLKNNQIKTISSIQSEHLMASLKSLDISSNPLNCNVEYWAWLLNKIKDNNDFLSDNDNTKCNEPVSAKYKKLTEALNLQIFIMELPHEMKESNFTSNFTAKRHPTRDRTEIYYGIIIFFSVTIPFLAVITCCNQIVSKFHAKSLSQATGCTGIPTIKGNLPQLRSDNEGCMPRELSDNLTTNISNSAVNNNEPCDDMICTVNVEVTGNK